MLPGNMHFLKPVAKLPRESKNNSNLWPATPNAANLPGRWPHEKFRPPARVRECAGRAPAATALFRGGDSLSPPFLPATGGTGNPPCGFLFRNSNSEFRTQGIQPNPT